MDPIPVDPAFAATTVEGFFVSCGVGSYLILLAAVLSVGITLAIGFGFKVKKATFIAVTVPFALLPVGLAIFFRNLGLGKIEAALQMTGAAERAALESMGKAEAEMCVSGGFPYFMAPVLFTVGVILFRVLKR